MSGTHYEGGTPHLDDPRQLEPDAGSCEGHPIQAKKLNVKRVQLTGVLVAGATVQINPLEFRGSLRRIQAKKVSGSAANYDLDFYVSDPAGSTHHDFDKIHSVAGLAVASDPYDSGIIDVPYENADAPSKRRSLWVTVTPDASGTPNVFDIQVIVEQRV